MAKINEKKLTWGFIFSLFALTINAFISYRDLIEQASNTAQVVWSREVLNKTADTESGIKDVELTRLRFLIEPTGLTQHNFELALDRLRAAMLDLKRLTASRVDRQQQVAHLDQLLQTLVQDMTTAEPPTQKNLRPTNPTVLLSATIQRTLDQLWGELQAIEVAETSAIEDRIEERRATIFRAFVTFSVASTLALLTIGFTYLLVRRYLSERERTERTLRENEARIRLLFDSVGEGIYGIDTAGCCTFCNPAALQLLGFSSIDDVIGQDMHQLVHHTRPDGSPFPARLCPIYQTFHSGQGVLGVEDFFFRADGQRIPVEYRAHAIRRGEEILGAVVTFVDITGKRRSEIEMRQRDRALQAIGQGVFISDLDRPGNPIIYANASFERLTGYASQDWRGKNLSELQSDEYVGASGEFVITASEGRELAAEMQARRKDGTQYRQSLTLAPVNDPMARSNHLVGVITDVSERHDAETKLRRSEERLRLMIESVRDYAIFSIDLRGRISSWNSGAERLFGFRESVILGELTSRLFLAEDQQAGVPAVELAEAMATGRMEDERWHMRSDGTRFLASGLTTAVRDEAGVLVGFTKVARDITESKRVETELREAIDAAESAVRAKSTFLANMGHELRTPLNAIIGYSEMLIEEAQERGLPEFATDLERIHEAGYLLLKLINNLLDLSKIEAGRMELSNQPFNIADLVRSVVRTVEPLAEKHGNVIQVVYPNDLGVLHADFSKISQGLIHLLNNAMKFTEAGTVHFQVTREVDADQQDWIIFTITDDGIGMTRDQISRLFQPFVQADASSARRYGGTGLGLTIANRFCQMMGGQMDVVSSPGQGSSFSMRIPIRADHIVNG